HQCVAPIPAEADKRNSAFDPQSRSLENLASLVHRHTRAYRIVDQDDRLVWVDLPFDQLQRTMFLALLADQQASVSPGRLQNARLNDRNGGQTVRRDLPAVKVAEEL